MASVVSSHTNLISVPANANIHYPDGFNFKPLTKSNKRIRFNLQHPSEIALTEFMNMHGIGWDYEGHVFVTEFHEEDGLFVPDEIFTPDFYLHDLNLHLELTSMKPKHRTAKNGKIRRALEYYTGTDIVLMEYREGIPEEVYNNGERVRLFDPHNERYAIGFGGHDFRCLEASFNYLYITREKMYVPKIEVAMPARLLSQSMELVFA